MKMKIAFLILAVLPSLSHAANDWYKSVLKSVNNASECAVNVSIDADFFDLIRDGETFEEHLKRSTLLGGGDEVDKALTLGGRVQINLQSLASNELQKRFSISTVDWRGAPYRANIRTRVMQGLDSYGKNLFKVRLDINFEEAAKSKTGITGFMRVYQFSGQTFARSKEGVEGKIYVALDRALDEMDKLVSESQKHCANISCK